jgi:signal-transduction protein with cAMP-binding, CBS, and nucleotidyltransferase domain
MTLKVKDVIRKVNPVVAESTPLKDAIIQMTEFGFGSITIVNKDQTLKGVFTDSDLRKILQAGTNGSLEKPMGQVCHVNPHTIESDALLDEALKKFKTTAVDTLVVMENGKPIGMLDIQNI